MRVGRVTTSMMCTVMAAMLAVACSGSAGSDGSAGGHLASLTGIHKIRHVIVIMQENRSFDSYFGTFPGADGIPMRKGKPTVCVPYPRNSTCIEPYADHSDVNFGGPHGMFAARTDIA